MSTYDNGAIETPEWVPEPRKWDVAMMLRATKHHVPDAEWSCCSADDLARTALAAYEAGELHECPTDACPFDPCFVCQPHEGGGTYPPPNAVLGEN